MDADGWPSRIIRPRGRRPNGVRLHNVTYGRREPIDPALWHTANNNLDRTAPSPLQNLHGHSDKTANCTTLPHCAHRLHARYITKRGSRSVSAFMFSRLALRSGETVQRKISPACIKLRRYSLRIAYRLCAIKETCYSDTRFLLFLFTYWNSPGISWYCSCWFALQIILSFETTLRFWKFSLNNPLLSSSSKSISFPLQVIY